MLLVLMLIGFGLFCAGSLNGCSSDKGVTDPGPHVEDPIPPDLPLGDKIPEVEQDTTGELGP
ncbi:MAG: hypothetical protein V1774_05430 [Candidatus Eisenbacteria bacterium]